MTPEQAVAYTEALSRRHGLGELSPVQREETIRSLHENPDIIREFVARAELNIEQAAARRDQEGEAA